MFSHTCIRVSTCHAYTRIHRSYQNTTVKRVFFLHTPSPPTPPPTPAPGQRISNQTGTESFQEPCSPCQRCEHRGALTSPWSTSSTCVDERPLVHKTDSLDSGSAVLLVLETWVLWVTKGDVSPSDLLLAMASTLTSFSSCSLSLFAFSFR